MIRLRLTTALLLTVAAGAPLRGAGPENVLVVVNGNSALSRSIGDYYARRRSIPAPNLCVIRSTAGETVTRAEYDRFIAAPISVCLKSRNLVESILYIVTTQGIPLRIRAVAKGDNAAVDSELTLLYSVLHGAKPQLGGPIPNPFFGQRDAHFRHPRFPIYLVTRLGAYDFAGVKAMIDRSLAAKNVGKFVLDLKSHDEEPGNDWLRNAAILLPGPRVVLEDSPAVLYGQKQVIGYAAWGSNDRHRKRRHLNFEWLPGAIATEYVSSNGRTFVRPPDNWNIGPWSDHSAYFAGTPQSLAVDLLAEGATGASGHVDEPYLAYTPRPDYLFPAYYSGRNLAESFYLAIPALSWQNIVIGDPLCSLGPPR